MLFSFQPLSWAIAQCVPAIIEFLNERLVLIETNVNICVVAKPEFNINQLDKDIVVAELTETTSFELENLCLCKAPETLDTDFYKFKRPPGVTHSG